jgi:hypothetical protein
MVQQSQPLQDADPGVEVAFPSLAFLNRRDSLMATILLPIAEISVQGGQGLVTRKVAGVNVVAFAASGEKRQSILVFKGSRAAADRALLDMENLR